MQGVLSDIQSSSYYNSNNALFPNSTQGNTSDGNPSEITTLTYNELMKTYNENYHPSNSTIVLYGNVDYEPFLKMIDENFLCNYSYKDYIVDRGTKPVFAQLQEKTYEFPVAQGTDTENSSVIELVFATKDSMEQGFENYVALNLVTQLLNLDNSDLKQALLNSNIADSYEIYLDESIASKLDENILENVIKEEIVNNASAALTLTFPKAGLLEKQQAEIAQTLAKMKASMPEEEIKVLVKKTNAFNNLEQTEVSQETLDFLQAVTFS